MGPGGLRRALAPRWLCWWAGLFCCWLLFVGEWTFDVAIWGAGLSLVATVAAAAVSSRGLLRGRLSLRWLPEAGSAAIQIPADMWLVTRALAGAIVSGRHELGSFREDDSAAGSDEAAAGRRAFVTLLATWSPNAYVVNIDAESGRRLVHELVPDKSSAEPT